ncbi:DUF3710 domain-containing protein [soil metagenome]
MFGRKKKASPDELDEQAAPVEPVDAPDDGAPVRPQGPWDDADAPTDEVNRIDLGGLRVPVPPDTEVRVDVSPEGAVVAATLVRGASAMQVNAFAAPRRAGIWDEIRGEIAATLREGGGKAVDVQGPFGVELHAAVPTEVAGQGKALAPARFLGVDGPRWFLRALLTGPAAVEAAEAVPMLTALKHCVVVRGSEAMAVRDPLPLRLPKEVTAAASAGSTAPAPLQPPERGPEITETR